MYSASDTYFIYLSFIPLIFFSILLAKKTHWIFPIVVIVIYSFMMGFRYNVGIDWEQFKLAYNDYVNDTSNIVRTYEPAYTFVNYLFAKVFGWHYASLFVLQSALYLTAIFVFSRLTKSALAAAVMCTIYYCISFFHAINTSRNFMAISIIIIGLYILFKDGKKILSFCIMIFGALCHYATLPFIPLIWLLYYYRSKPNFIVLAAIYMVIFALFRLDIGILNDSVYQIMYSLSDLTGENRFEVYTDLEFLSESSRYYHELSVLRTTIFVVLNLVFLLLACIKYNTLTSVYYKMIYWCAIIYVLITNSFQNFEILYRLTYIFEPMFCFVIGDFIINKAKENTINWAKIYGIGYTLLMLYQFVVDINLKLTVHGTFFYYKMINHIDRILF